MRETRQSGSEGGARNIPLSLPLSLTASGILVSGHDGSLGQRALPEIRAARRRSHPDQADRSKQ